MPTEPTNVPGDLVVGGTLRPRALAVPAACVGNNNVNPSDPIQSANLGHRHHKQLNQVHGSAAIAERRIVHRAYGAGTLTSVRAAIAVAAAGDATVTVDVRKNGTTVLSATISVTSATAAYGSVAGAISTASYSAGDCFEVVVTVNAGTGTLPQGLCVDLVFTEAA